jgi:hypothetical protein
MMSFSKWAPLKSTMHSLLFSDWMTARDHTPKSLRAKNFDTSLTLITCTAKSSKRLRSSTRGRLYSCDALLEPLAQDLQDVASALRLCIQQEDAVVCQ